MAVITLNIPAGAPTTRTVTAVCTNHQYQPTLPNGSPNPQTPLEFFKAWLVKAIKKEVKEYESNLNAAAAVTATESDIDNNVIISAT